MMNTFKSIGKTLITSALSLSLVLAVAACGGNQKTGTAKSEAPAKSAGIVIKTKDDLKNLNLSAQRGTVGQTIAEELLGDKAEKNLKTYEKYADAVQALTQGKVQAVIMDQKPAENFVAKNDKLVIMNPPIQEENYAIGIKKGNTAMLKLVNDTISRMKADGSLAKLFKKYEKLDGIKASDIDLNKGAKGGKLIVGTEAGFAPYELKVSDGYIGIDVELCAAIAKAADKELVIKDMAFDSLPAALNAGQVDMICAGITVTNERKENMDFSEAYYEGAKQVAVVLKSEYAGK